MAAESVTLMISVTRMHAMPDVHGIIGPHRHQVVAGVAQAENNLAWEIAVN